MALAKPPPAVFGGGVISVNSASDMPSKPLVTVAIRIQISQNSPNAMVAIDRNSARRFSAGAGLHFAAAFRQNDCVLHIHRRHVNAPHSWPDA